MIFEIAVLCHLRASHSNRILVMVNKDQILQMTLPRSHFNLLAIYKNVGSDA